MPNLASISGSARERALQILWRIEVQGAFADRLLYTAATQAGLADHDQALLQQLVKGTLQQRGSLDAVLERRVKSGIATLTPWIRNILRLGAYQVLYLDRTPPEVAVSDAVELAKKYGHKGTVGLVNAVLRRVAADAPNRQSTPAHAEPPQSAEAIAESYSHPLWIVRRWLAQIGPAETIALCEADNRPWPLCLRTNTLRISSERLRERLDAEGVAVAPARYAADCTIMRQLPPNTRLHELASYRAGLFQVQDESAALVAQLVNPQPGELVIDLCSAPGGKTTALAALMGNQGRILACDLYENRLQLVRANCERLGVTIAEYQGADARALVLAQPADRVLLDAPCSGLGVLGRKSDVRWNKHEEDITRLSTLQAELIHHAATLVRAGGTLIYSTCTLEHTENERVVEDFLEYNPTFQLLPPPDSMPPELVTPQGYYYAWPQRHGVAGAFGAVLKRER
ncbi:MAG: 16S rRNA (cytosine(967)-C(5))-methyltransferase RsmB [Chloroflexales bacterium]|nr:16S rRNA (cytosine(967)-C(5))-methyltransferase RsmB [Chloroflexales bacterium]